MLVTHLPYSILKSAVTVYLYMAFSPLKNFASTVFFFLRFRTNIFPFPVDIFSEKQKFCSSFVCKLGEPFIKLSSFISILYKKFILISLFQSFNSVFPWGWIQSSRLTRYKCPCTCLDSRTKLDNMPTEY